MPIPSWHKYGECRDYDPELFFDPDQEDFAASICVTYCRVKDICLTWALTHPKMTQFGVWGGLTEGQRRKAGTKRDRVKCPGCGSYDIEELRNRHAGCLACGLSWPV